MSVYAIEERPDGTKVILDPFSRRPFSKKKLSPEEEASVLAAIAGCEAKQKSAEMQPA